MTDLCTLLGVAALALELVGLYFMFKEVWLGHEASDHESNFTRLNHIIELMQRGQWVEAYALFHWYENPEARTLADARAFAATIGPAHAQQAMQNVWQKGGWQQVVEDSYANFAYRHLPAALRRRKRDFLFGAVLVIVALLLAAVALLCKVTPEPPPQPPPDTTTRVLVTGPEVVRFDPAESSLQYVIPQGPVDLSEEACRAKRKLQATNVIAVLVVGRFDQRELTPQARKRITSNEALAQQRADTVADYLRSSETCGPGFEKVITFASAPRSGVPGAVEEALAADRSVEIYALSTSEEKSL